MSSVARAMENLLPYKYLTKIDRELLNPKKLRFYDSIMIGATSAAFFVAGFYFLTWNYFMDTTMFFIAGVSLAISSIWYFLIYIRSRSKTKMTETFPEQYYRKDFSIHGVAAFGDQTENVLPALNTSELTDTPASVTERTTKLLDESERK